MPETPRDLTLDELRNRIKATGLPIPDARLEMVRKLLGDALKPIRAADWRKTKTLEPVLGDLDTGCLHAVAQLFQGHGGPPVWENTATSIPTGGGLMTRVCRVLGSALIRP